MPPRDVNAEADLQRAEPDPQPHVAPRRRRDERGEPEPHEADPQQPHRRDAERAAGHDAGAVEQQPHRRHQRPHAVHPQADGQRRAGDQRRRKTQRKSAGRARRSAAAPTRAALRRIVSTPNDQRDTGGASQTASQRSAVGCNRADDRGHQSDAAHHRAARIPARP